MSDTERALLAAVRENPADDLPRLMLADEIELAEPERAEFVRVQVELSRREWVCEGCRPGRVYCYEGCPDCDDHSALRRRERELLDEHWSGWIRGAGLVPDGWKLSTDGDSFHVWHDAPFDDGFRFQFRRGFVASVSLPLAALVGGPCGRCDNGIVRHAHVHSGRIVASEKCRHCTPGVAPALFSCQPVERVSLTDRETHPSPPGLSGPWAFYRADPRRIVAADRYVLPEGLFWHPGGWLSENGNWKDFPTRQAAEDWLSAACVAYGRGLAGLTPPAAGLKK